jgi:hypothetical protein
VLVPHVDSSDLREEIFWIGEKAWIPRCSVMVRETGFARLISHEEISGSGSLCYHLFVWQIGNFKLPRGPCMTVPTNLF